MSAVDGPGQPLVGGAGQREQPSPLELEQQPGQRVGQDIVHVAGQPLPFGQRGRAKFGAAALPSSISNCSAWASCVLIRGPNSTIM